MQLSLHLKHTALVLSMLLLSACSTKQHHSYQDTVPTTNQGIIGDYHYSETLELPFSEEPPHWVIAYQVALPGASLAEVIPEGDSINNWSELVSVSFISYTILSNLTTMQQAMQDKIELAQAKCGSHATITILDEKPKEIIYEMQLTGCGSRINADQTQISRIIKGVHGFNAVHYSVKAPWVTVEKQQEMLTFVENARLVR